VVGFELSASRRYFDLRQEWRYRRYSFFGTILPLFSFCGGCVLVAKKSLAGDEKYESKSSQLPSLWPIPVAGSLERYECEEANDHQMSSMSKLQSVEGCSSPHILWRSAAALLMPRLCLPVFLLIAVSCNFLLFIFLG
jgi:hypothetical protein